MRKLLSLSATAAALLGAYLFGQATSIASVIPTIITKTAAATLPPPVKIEVSPIILVQAMEEKFETTTFSMNLTADNVKAGRCDGNLWQDFAYRDCLKMQVPGTVNAGFGREILDPTRITTTKDGITFDIGTPSINPKVYIDHARVKVTNPDDTPGLLVNADKNLQAMGFAQAEQKLHDAACQANILLSAGLSAEKKYGDMTRNILALAGDHRQVKIVYHIPTCTIRS